MKRFLWLCAFASLLLAAHTTRGPMSFDDFDTNKDGTLNQEEFDAAKAQRMSARAQAGGGMKNAADAPDFAYFDINHDGKVTKDEFRQKQLERLKNRRN